MKREESMPNGFCDFGEISRRISEGEPLLLAADEEVLRRLPRGNWIGGTIPDMAIGPSDPSSKERIFTTELSRAVMRTSIKVYDKETLRSIYSEIPEHGLGMILIPAESPTHFSFALNAPTYPGFATRPLAGWVAGVRLEQLNHASAKVFDGRTGESHGDRALVMHAELAAGKYADIGIINIFEPSEGDAIMFERDGFVQTEALIGNRKVAFAKYLRENDVDLRLPLVADYQGVMVNSSFQSVDERSGEVKLYAPLFRGIRYRLAKPIHDFDAEFGRRLATLRSLKGPVVFSCNCVLNYLFSTPGAFSAAPGRGPATFGEVAYQLLNQTMVYVVIDDHN